MNVTFAATDFSDWVSAAATLLAAVLGVAAILLQLGRQGRLNRESVAENERRRLKSHMYEEASAACTAFTEANARYLARILASTIELQVAAYSHRDSVPYSLPSGRIMEIANLKSEYQTASIELVSLIERRQFIAPSIIIFRTALAAANHDAERKFSRDFFQAGMRMFPTDRPDGQGVFPYTPPTPDDADALNRVALSIVGDLQTAGSYVTDFSVEMQNLLVTDLFDTTVAHRVPIDPNCKVIRLDDAENLERYFMEETDWGRWVREEEDKARGRLDGSPVNTGSAAPD